MLLSLQMREWRQLPVIFSCFVLSDLVTASYKWNACREIIYFAFYLWNDFVNERETRKVIRRCWISCSCNIGMSAFLTDNPDTIIWGNWLTQRQKKNYLDICYAKTTFTIHFSTLSNSFLNINNREMKSESGFSIAMASQPFWFGFRKF